MEYVRDGGVERPAPVLMAARDHDFDGLSGTAVGIDSRISQIIESAHDVVMPRRRVREAQRALGDDFAGSQRTKHAALGQILFGPLACLRDRRRLAACSFVIEQAFEHADRGME
jgi:hypothetical protein